MLIDKITAKVRISSSRNISYARRSVIINLLLMGVIGFWCRTFLLPQQVWKEITAICRNFLWGGNEKYNGVPIAWDVTL